MTVSYTSTGGAFQALQRYMTIQVRLRQSDAPTAVPAPDVLGQRP
jgi:hypothetical protein